MSRTSHRVCDECTTPRHLFQKKKKWDLKQSDDASYVHFSRILRQNVTITQVNDEASDRVLEVEREFNTKRRPIFEKRNRIIAGVEGFWRTAFLNHPALSTLFTADDVELLSYVTQVSDALVFPLSFVATPCVRARRNFFIVVVLRMYKNRRR